MQINVNPKLTELLARIEERERGEVNNCHWQWLFNPDGNGAYTRFAVQYPYREYDVYVADDHYFVEVMDTGKYGGGDWETDPFGTDYEAPEEEEEL